jgi:LytTr DNA-binding domain
MLSLKPASDQATFAGHLIRLRNLLGATPSQGDLTGRGGDENGTRDAPRAAFVLGFVAVALSAFVVDGLAVITAYHAEPGPGFGRPVLGEGTSWLALLAVMWIPWLAFRLAPPDVRPRWRLLIHAPFVLAYSLAHVSGFILLRTALLAMAGGHYSFGPFVPNFAYEFSKDVMGYPLIIGGFKVAWLWVKRGKSEGQQKAPATFDVRDGAKLTRVNLAQILAVSSAGNYVSFHSHDGRKVLMRSTLAGIEKELAPHGFVRTHRSWLVNATQVRGLTPQGSGDFSVELDGLTVPLSRRFPGAVTVMKDARA